MSFILLTLAPPAWMSLIALGGINLSIFGHNLFSGIKRILFNLDTPASSLNMKSQSLSRCITAVAIAGVLVSTYALYVEMTAEAHPEYKALCDIAEYASCSRVLTSKYSKGFGVLPKESSLEVPNCIYGILFYCIIIFLATFDNKFIVRLQLYLAVASVVSSFYLAYLLAFVLRDFCIVCVSTYFINGGLVALVYKKDKSLTQKNK